MRTRPNGFKPVQTLVSFDWCKVCVGPNGSGQPTLEHPYSFPIIASYSSPFPSTSGTRRLRANPIPSRPHNYSFFPFAPVLPPFFGLWTTTVERRLALAATVTTRQQYAPRIQFLASSPITNHFPYFFDIFHTFSTASMDAFSHSGNSSY